MSLSIKLKEQVVSVLHAVEEEIRAQYDESNHSFVNSGLARDYFQLRLAGEEREHFEVALLDNQHKLITTVRLFSGTLGTSAVYPREIVKAAMQHNASAILLAHNHPSGVMRPSEADLQITKRIKDAAELLDITVLDHIIVGINDTYSMAQHGQV